MFALALISRSLDLDVIANAFIHHPGDDALVDLTLIHVFLGDRDDRW